MNKYKLTIYNNAYDFDECIIEHHNCFSDAYAKAHAIIVDHLLNEKQIYGSTNTLPFKASVHINSLYDDLKINDDQIIIFEKLIIVFNHMLEENDNIIKFIKNDINYDCIDEDDCHYSFKINKEKEDGLLLSIYTDEDYLITNMFNIRDNYDYLFESYQEVIIGSKYDNRQLGEKVYLRVELEKE